MQQKVSFTVTHTDGTVDTFYEDPHRTLFEILGGEMLARSELICQNRHVNKFMTLSYANIVDGSNLYIVEFRTTADLRLYLSESLQEALWRELIREEFDFGSRRHEAARINDVMWSARELSPYYPEMMGMAMKAVQAKEEDAKSEAEGAPPMDLSGGSDISVAPLPLCFPSPDIPVGKGKGKAE
jgi:hypothetical protein